MRPLRSRVSCTRDRVSCTRHRVFCVRDGVFCARPSLGRRRLEDTLTTDALPHCRTDALTHDCLVARAAVTAG
ncbi:hypothetical protein LY15_002464 [Prauserella flava]|nr:hypothetical protein [Prauserella flava]MCR3733800.1 hypothetical protein [Prauserella salsuginis]